MNAPELNYASPARFTWPQRITLAVVPTLIAACLKSIYATCTVVGRGMEHWDRVVESGGHALVGFWHECMGLAACYHRNTGFHTLTSYSFDGELAARVVERFGLKALRGSSTRGGMKALADMTLATQSIQMVGFTLDGPKGPRRRAKPGIAILAARTRLPILPRAFAVKRALHRFPSWDRLPIPMPGTTILHACGAPIPPPRDLSREAVEETRRKVERALNTLHEEIEAELGCDVGLDRPHAT